MILVTGASGFIGSHLVAEWRSFGLPVAALYSPSTSNPGRGEGNLVGHLADHRFLESISFSPNCIVHAASNSGRRGEDYARLWNDNVKSTENLVEFALERNTPRIIYLSSVSVHGLIDGGVLSKSSRVRPSTPYGHTKMAAESVLEEASEKLDSVAIRLPGVLGTGAPLHLLSQWVAKAKKSESIEIKNPWSLFNNVVHVQDLVAFAGKLVSDPAVRGFDAFPLASASPLTLNEAVTILRQELKSSSLIKHSQVYSPGFYIDDSYARDVFTYSSMTTRNAIKLFARECRRTN